MSRQTALTRKANSEAAGHSPPSDPIQSTTVTVEEGCQTLGIGRDRWYNSLQNGEIPSIPIGKRRVVTRVMWEAFLRTGRNPASAGQGREMTA